MENQPKVITFGRLNKYDELRPQVKPVKATYEEMTEMRDQGKLIPGQYYQITDYVTTVNEPLNPNARSAGHPFDILVRADSADTLNEQAWAVKHEGDTYFEDARLEAWELKYRLDNVQWSKQAGTYVTDEEKGYTFLVVGDITLSGHTYKLLQGFGMYVEDWSDYALMETVAEGEQIICYYGVPEEFDPEEPEVVGTASGVEEVTESGRGTITWMKDEHGNECPYDFKNMQFKRWMTTDSVSGREELGGKYMVADPDNCPQGLSVEDTEDFIWAYTFSSDNSGGEQTDFSLTAEHKVRDNVMNPYDGGLPNNVMFGEHNYGNSFGANCYDNSWGNYCYYNSWGNYCQHNSWGNRCQYNSWGNYCQNNSWGNGCSRNSWGNNNWYNSWGNGCYGNSWGNECYYNSWGINCYYNSWGNGCQHNSWGNNNWYNSWGNGCQYNSWGNNCYCNSWGNECYYNSWGNNVTTTTVFDGVQHTQITTENVKNAQVLNGVAGTSSSKLTLTFAANKTYTQVAAMTSANALKIYVPGDLA